MEIINYKDDWVFLPGMCFRDREKWWKKGFRQNPHEGLDFYQTKYEIVSAKTRVTALSGGKVIRIIDDFLGQTVFINSGDLILVYAHINPVVKEQQTIKKNQILGRLAGSNNPPSHLHLTAVKVLKDFDLGSLDWNFLNQDKKIKLINPLEIMP